MLGLAAVTLLVALHWVLPVTDPATGRVTTASAAVLVDTAGWWVPTVAACWLAAYQTGVLVRSGTVDRLRPAHGLALAARPLIDRWTAGDPVAGGLSWLAPRLVTVYLWHLPAVALVAVVAVRVTGYAPPAGFGGQWRADLPWWLLNAAVVLAAVVRLIGSVGTALPRTHGLTGSSTLQSHGRLEA